MLSEFLNFSFSIELFAIIFEISITFIFLDSALKRKYESKTLYVAVTILMIVLYAYFEYEHIFANYKLFVFLLTVTLLACFLYKGSYANKIIMSVMLLVLFILADLTTYCIDKKFNSLILHLTNNPNYARIAMIFTSKILFLIYVKLFNIKRISFHKNVRLTAIYFTLIIFIPLLSIVVFFTITYCYQFIPNNNNIYSLLFIVNISMFYINLFIFDVYEALLKGVQTENELKLKQQQYELQANFIEATEKCRDSIRAIKHDISNHLFCIQSFLDKGCIDDAKDYINRIDKDITINDMFSNCGNLIIDALLNYKYDVFKKESISVKKEIKVPKKLNVENADLCIVLSNIIDNAVDALKKVKSENRFIDLRIDYDKELLVIKIKNNFEDEPKFSNNNLITSKENKDIHGMGIKNVKNTVAEYDGYVNIDIKDKIFSVEIFMCDKKLQ